MNRKTQIAQAPQTQLAQTNQHQLNQMFNGLPPQLQSMAVQNGVQVFCLVINGTATSTPQAPQQASPQALQQPVGSKVYQLPGKAEPKAEPNVNAPRALPGRIVWETQTGYKHLISAQYHQGPGQVALPTPQHLLGAEHRYLKAVEQAMERDYPGEHFRVSLSGTTVLVDVPAKMRKRSVNVNDFITMMGRDHRGLTYTEQIKVMNVGETLSWKVDLSQSPSAFSSFTRSVAALTGKLSAQTGAQYEYVNDSQTGDYMLMRKA